MSSVLTATGKGFTDVYNAAKECFNPETHEKQDSVSGEFALKSEQGEMSSPSTGKNWSIGPLQRVSPQHPYVMIMATLIATVILAKLAFYLTLGISLVFAANVIFHEPQKTLEGLNELPNGLNLTSEAKKLVNKAVSWFKSLNDPVDDENAETAQENKSIRRASSSQGDAATFYPRTSSSSFQELGGPVLTSNIVPETEEKK